MALQVQTTGTTRRAYQSEASLEQKAPRNRKVFRILSPIIAMGVILAIWQLIVSLFHVPRYVLPAPTAFLPLLVKDWGELWSATIVTAEEGIFGFGVAIIVGIALALVLASFRIIRELVYPIIVFLQVIPIIAVAPLFIVWFGTGRPSVVLLTFVICFFPILVNAMIGFMSIDHQLLYITKSMGASRFQTLRYVRFPSAVTYIFAGLKISVVLAVIGVIVGEFVGSNAGLGYLLEASAGILNTSLVFADLVILSVLGLILNYLVLACEWLVTPWKRNSERNS